MLTPLELDIMKAIWQRSPITVKDVQLALRPKRRLAYTSVMTTMNRLYLKGFVSRSLHARAHQYEPVVSFIKARQEALDGLIADFFNGSGESLSSFLNGAEVEVQSAPELVRPAAFDETLL